MQVPAGIWPGRASGRCPDFYVPDDRTLRIAKEIYGEARTNADRGATVTVASTPWIVNHRYDPGKRRPEEARSGRYRIPSSPRSISPGEGPEVGRSWRPSTPHRDSAVSGEPRIVLVADAAGTMDD